MLPLQALGGAHACDESDTWVHHVLQECNLCLLACCQSRGVEGWHFNISSPRLTIPVKRRHQRSCTLNHWKTRPSMQWLSDKWRECMQPLRLEHVVVPLALSLVGHLELLAAVDGRCLAHSEVAE